MRASDDSVETVDLLALDKNGRTVVVSLHQDDEPSQLTRSLVCASLVASWKPPQIFECLSPRSTRDLKAFLEVDLNAINQEQQHLLIAESFTEEDLSATKWLAQRGRIELTCIRVTLALDRQTHNEYLSCVQLFPPSEDQGELSTTGEAAEGAAILIEESQTVSQPLVGLSEVPTDQAEPSSEPSPAAAHSSVETSGSVAAEETEQDLIAQLEVKDGAETAEDAEETSSLIEPTEDSSSLMMPPDTSEGTPTADTLEEPKRVSRPLRLRLAAVVVVAIPFFLFFSRPWDEWPPAAALELGGESQSPVQEAVQPVLDVVDGVVTEKGSGRPISGAQAYYAGELAMTDQDGRFRFHRQPEHDRVQLKAAGYRQYGGTVNAGPMKLELERLDVRAIYVNRQKISSSERRKSVFSLIRQTGSNAVVVTIKDTRGELSIPIGHPFGQGIGAFRDEGMNRLLRDALKDFKSKRIYTIARVAVFKDGLLARKKPETALRSLASNRVILGTGDIPWTDPSTPSVQEYNLEVIRAAAQAGFDEVMLDFIRYPANALSLEGATPQERKHRLKTIVGFLRKVAEVLAPHNVYVGASVFGSVCTMQSTGVVGQKLEEFAAAVDYVYPMLYPSQFQASAKYPRPVEQPYRLIRDNLRAAATRIGDSRKLRPWLQNFPDDSSSRVPLRVEQIRAQIKASNDEGTSGWMLWDPRSRYINTPQAITDLLALSASGVGRVEPNSYLATERN